MTEELTADVRITGFNEGTHKNVGKLGSFETAHGNVGTGLTDADRVFFWSHRSEVIGKIIQVGYREMSADNKLLNACFVKVRWNKHKESFNHGITKETTQ